MSNCAFYTMVPSKLILKQRHLGLGTPICYWIIDFLTIRPEVVMIGSNTYQSSSAPEHHKAAAADHGCNVCSHMIGSPADTMVQVQQSCVEHRWTSSVISFHFLGLQISDDLAWTHNTGVMLKKAHQHLRCLRKCNRWLVNFYHGQGQAGSRTVSTHRQCAY